MSVFLMLPHPHRNKQYGIFNPRFIGYLHNVKEKSKQCQSNTNNGLNECFSSETAERRGIPATSAGINFKVSP